jgi:hypothetical protein
MSSYKTQETVYLKDTGAPVVITGVTLGADGEPVLRVRPAGATKANAEERTVSASEVTKGAVSPSVAHDYQQVVRLVGQAQQAAAKATVKATPQEIFRAKRSAIADINAFYRAGDASSDKVSAFVTTLARNLEPVLRDPNSFVNVVRVRRFLKEAPTSDRPMTLLLSIANLLNAKQ